MVLDGMVMPLTLRARRKVSRASIVAAVECNTWIFAYPAVCGNSITDLEW